MANISHSSHSSHPNTSSKRRISKVQEGVNGLASQYPEIAKDWSDENPIKPNEVHCGSSKKYKWKCHKCGNKWEDSVFHRTKRNAQCPECKKKQQPSVLDNNITVTHPELAAEWDYEKNGNLMPQHVSAGTSHTHCWWRCKNGHSFKQAPSQRTRNQEAPHFNACPHCSHTIPAPGEYSLYTEYPELMKEWDWEKNQEEGLDPDSLLPSSNKKAHWRCSKGHHWVAPIYSRSKMGTGCAICAGKAPEPGVNDLATTHPELIKEWDYDKNGELMPDQVMAGTTKKVWWRCKNGHSFERKIYDRTRRRTAPDYAECPHCSHSIPTPGEYSLKTEYPELIEEWDWEKNQKVGLDPDNILPGSNKKAHWKCENGHEWKATICSRTRQGVGCAVCVGLQAAPGQYSLHTEHPELLNEWDWEENEKEGLYPDTLHPQSTSKVHWLCSEGHQWVESIKDRMRGNNWAKCPQCFPRRDLKFRPGVNDLATAYPEIAKEWSDRNPISASEVHGGSGKKYWWKCKHGHEWEARVNHRTVDGNGCPVCAGFVASEDNNLAVLYPDVAAEWNWEKNNELFDGRGPQDFLPFSSAVAYWQCPKNPKHNYKERIGHRSEGFGCPFCSHHQIIPGDNSVAAEYPELIEEWDWEKNNQNGIDPDTIAPGSSLKVWWKCKECGHEWPATIGDRATKGHGCQVCKQGIGTSFAEQVCFFGAKMLFPEHKVINRHHTAFHREIDVYIPDLHIGLEPGHWDFHKDRLDRDREKIQECAEHGIRVFTLFEQFPEGEELPLDKDCYAYSKSARRKYAYLLIRDILKEIFADYDIADELWEDEKWHEVASLAHIKMGNLDE